MSCSCMCVFICDAQRDRDSGRDTHVVNGPRRSWGGRSGSRRTGQRAVHGKQDDLADFQPNLVRRIEMLGGDGEEN